MIRIIAALAGAFCIFAGTVTPAAAQTSNALGASPEAGGTVSEADIAAAGINLLVPSAIAQLVTENGLTVVQSDPLPDQNGHLLVGTVDGAVFIFLFQECFASGCLLMQQIHPVPTAAAGLRMPLDLINQLNLEIPLGSVYSDGEGNIVARYSVIASPECQTACVRNQMAAYVGVVKILYAVLDQLISRATVSTEDGIGALAASGRNPLMMAGALPAFATITVPAATGPAGSFAGIGAAPRMSAAADLEIDALLAMAGVVKPSAASSDWAPLTE